MKIMHFMRKITPLFLVSVIIAVGSCGGSGSIYWGNWVFDGPVSAIKVYNGKIYAGGNFTYTAVSSGYGATVNSTTGMIPPKVKQPQINDIVYAAVPDGAGGWYIGGNFTQVGSKTRNHIARINANGSVNAWDPDADGAVRAIVVSGSTVYIGGNFQNLKSSTTPVPRNRIAAINAKTGVPATWNPNASDQVDCMALSGTTLYVGGKFNDLGTGAISIGGASRNCLAAISTTTGNATTWNPNIYSPAPPEVMCMALSGNTLYIGGVIVRVGGIAGTVRFGLAAFDTTTGGLTAWDPYAGGGGVATLAVSGNTVFVGGTFTSFGGGAYPCNRLGALDATTGSLRTDWAPEPDGAVYSLSVDSTKKVVYAAGAFNSIGGWTRRGIAAVTADPSNWSNHGATSWDPLTPGATGTVINTKSDKVFIGGGFPQGINHYARNNIAAFDGATGLILPDWDANVDNVVNAIAVSKSAVYIGGLFTTLNGGTVTQDYLAALDPITGAAITTWDPVLNGEVNTLALSGNTLYAGGSFDTIDAASHMYVAAINTTTHTATAWNPGVSGIVRTIALGGGLVYLGGSFNGDNSVGSAHRDFLAAVQASDGAVTSWDPDPDAAVRAMLYNNGILYVGGSFNSFIDGADIRPCVAALDTTTTVPADIALDWVPNPNGAVFALAYSNNILYAGGAFTSLNSGTVTRNHLAALDTKATTASKITLGWDPNANDMVMSLAVSGNNVLAGGSFTTIYGIALPCMSVIDIDTGIPYGN